jgi:type I restriction enzyme R subunit
MTAPSPLPGFDPSEAADSQIPALQLLAAMGWEILPRAQVERLRGKLSRVLLADVLSDWLLASNSFNRRGETHRFNEADADEAIRQLTPDSSALKGLVGTNKDIYDRLLLGATISKTVDGDRKSQTMMYVDWERPERNRFHATAEMSVERVGAADTRRCDIVLFVNGIPFGVIECKGADHDVKEASSQLLRYQGAGEIPHLFHYAQLLIGVNRREGIYGTVSTPQRFWARWREEEAAESEIEALLEHRPTPEQVAALFSGEFARHRGFFEGRAEFRRQITEQDRILHALCRPERLLELTRIFSVFDGGVRKVARYQQFFGIRRVMERIRTRDDKGRRRGGVVWHTQGSGKSLTMVMLGRALTFSPEITAPRILIITDRKDLDKQIRDTFASCDLEPERATTGRDLLEKLRDGRRLLTAVINKFDTAMRVGQEPDEDDDIFILVDESHRTQHGGFAAQMRALLPKACYLGFTGTPILKRDKSTADKFGGIIHKYTIDQAVQDGAVVPLLYEGRFVDQSFNAANIDAWFERETEEASAATRTALRRKFSQLSLLSQTEGAIFARARDISKHFRDTWQGTGFKAQLVAPSKAAAIRYKEILDEIGEVSSEVVISPPNEREGPETVDTPSRQKVQAFWAAQMARFGNNPEKYEEAIVERFKNGDDPEILIVVSKLLTGFDAPCNTVLYLCRSLKEHGLLQAIARVNRLCTIGETPKEFGYVIDYEGLLANLDKALTAYSSLEGYDEEDLVGALHDVSGEICKLPQRHGEVWDVFREVGDKSDTEALEEHLAPQDRRDAFVAALRAFGKNLHIALSSEKAIEIHSRAKLDAWSKDFARFERIRRSVQRRFGDLPDLTKLEPQLRALLDREVQSAPPEVIVEQIDITDRETLRKVLEEESTSDASKADAIASATRRTLTERMEEDPALYARFSQMLEETIAAYRAKRMSEKDYLSRVMDLAEEATGKPRGPEAPAPIRDDPDAQAFFGVMREFQVLKEAPPETVALVARDMADIIRERLIVRFWANDDAQKDLRNALDDYLFDVAPTQGLPLEHDAIDDLVEAILRIARARFAR